MNGHWLHKCLNATGERVKPLPSLGRGWRATWHASPQQAFIGDPTPLRHRALRSRRRAQWITPALLKRLRRGDGLIPTDKQCCTLKVLAISAPAKRLPPTVCDGL